MAKLIDILSKSPVGSAAVAAVPGGSLALKVLGGANALVSRIISNKKDKAKAKLDEAKARLAQFESLQGKGLVNRGTDQPTSPVLAAVLGQQPTEKKGYYGPEKELVRFSELEKMNEKDKKEKMEKAKTWLMSYWYYVAGGLVVAYMLFRKKRR